MKILLGCFEDTISKVHWVYLDSETLNIYEHNEDEDKLEIAKIEVLKELYDLVKDIDYEEFWTNVHSPLFDNIECYITPSKDNDNHMCNFVVGYGSNKTEAAEDAHENLSLLEEAVTL